MRWREIPPYARNYIIYHTFISPLLIVWYLLPMYMFMTGYSILDIGIIFTLVQVAAIPLTYLIGRAFEKIAIRKGLVLIDALDGLSSILYSLAYGVLAPLFLFLGILVDNISRYFYPLYKAAEKILYPKERLEEIFSWHMRLPELSQMVAFPIFGYIFGYIIFNPHAYRIGFFLIGISSIFTIAYLYKFLPPLDKDERIEEESFIFRVDKEFRLILLMEAIDTLAWTLAPTIVLLNYIVNVLGLTFFEAMVVEAFVSAGGFFASYLSERIAPNHRFRVIGAGYILISLWALIMYLNPPFILVVVAYFISRFGDTLMFPFYFSWLFEKIPKDRASGLFAALSSYDKVIGLFSPAIAGFLATIYPTLPYIMSLFMFILAALLMVIYSRLRPLYY